MKIGYIRHRLDNCNIEDQIAILKQQGCEQIIVGNKSESKHNELKTLVTPDDLVVVPSFILLANSIPSLFKLLNFLINQNVQLHCLDEQIRLPEDREIFNHLIEFEKEITLERATQALLIAKKKGKVGGRKKISLAKVKAIQQLSRSNKTVSEICDTLKISRSTYYKYYNVSDSVDSPV